jgi:hypothetical protein
MMAIEELQWYVWKNSHELWAYGHPILMILAKSVEDARQVLFQQMVARSLDDDCDDDIIGNVALFNINIDDFMGEPMYILPITNVFFFNGSN